MRNRLDTIRLALGLGVSLVLHATLVVPGFVTVLTDTSETPASADQHSAASQDESRQPSPKDREVELGLEQSDASTMTWIGYDEYREHLARLAEVEQAAFMTEPVGEPDALQSNQMNQASARSDSDVDDAQSAPDAPQEIEQVVLLPMPALRGPMLTPPTEALTEVDESAAPAPPLVDKPREEREAATSNTSNESPMTDDAWRELLAALHRALRQPEQPAQETQTKTESDTESEQQSSNGSSSSSRRGEQREAEQAEKESDATSTVDVPLDKLDPGKPLAAQGMELKPKRPTFTILQKVTSSPGNPVGEITFDHRGVPSQVELIKSSYVSSVDQSVKDSLYGWRASGKEIDALEKGETISVRIRIILNPHAR